MPIACNDVKSGSYDSYTSILERKKQQADYNPHGNMRFSLEN